MAKKASAAAKADELPAIGETTGPAMDAHVALRALATADDDDDAGQNVQQSTQGDGAGSGEAGSPETALHDVPDRPTSASSPGPESSPSPAAVVAPKKPAPPKRSETPENKAALRERKAKKLKRDAVLALYLESAGRADELEKRVESMQVEVAAVRQVGADVIDQSVTDMVTDGIDFLDASAQALAGLKGDHFADAVKLDARERDRAILLTARVAKIEGAAYLEHSPKFALGFFALTTILGKYLAFKLAQKSAAESAAPAE